jgi:hypothetical protein
MSQPDTIYVSRAGASPQRDEDVVSNPFRAGIGRILKGVTQARDISRMKTRALVELMAESWARAEQALISTVRAKYSDRDEEMITDLFHAELEEECKRISAFGAVEAAFKTDLRRALPHLENSDVAKISRGLVATVRFHPRNVERRTGGDYGLVFVRPDVHYSRFSPATLDINEDYRRGLLCQAKIFRRDSSWGRLLPKQQRVLEQRLQYLSLVLYRYTDQDGPRRELGPFQWQLTHDAISVQDIVGWLRSDNFPRLRSSRDVITKLADGRIGTDNNQLISEFIAPTVRPSLEIRIQWGDRPSPGRTLQVRNCSQQQLVYQRN